MGRLGLAVLVFLMISLGLHAWALGLFVIAAVSDALDGYFARLLNQDTPLGRQLDPLIDKVIVSGAYIYLAAIPGTGVYPWMVTAIVVRELLIQGLRSLLEGQGQAFGAKMAGKLKTLFQCLSISAVLFCLSLEAPPACAHDGSRRVDVDGRRPDHLQRRQLPHRGDAGLAGRSVTALSGFTSYAWGGVEADFAPRLLLVRTPNELANQNGMA